MRKQLAVAALLGFAATAGAQERSGPYVGLSVGSFSYQEEDEFGVLIDDSSTSYRAFGGYQFNDNFAVDVGYGTSGDLKETFPVFVPPNSVDSVELKAEYTLITARFLALVPLDSMDMYAGVGGYDADVEATFTGFGTTETAKDSESGATVAGGIQFDLDEFTIRGEYEWFDTDGDVEAWNVSIGILYRF